jgi:hypothetical protein
VNQNAEGTVVQGLGHSKGLPLRAYSVVRSTSELLSDCPNLEENPLLLFTLAYSELIETLADALFPPNEVPDAKGVPHFLRASSCRIDRHIHFRSVWQPPFGIRIQLALRDLTGACTKRFDGRHFVVLKESERGDILTELQNGSLPSSQWTTTRPQVDAFNSIYEAVSCGLLADPGYGGNAKAIGWFYTRFMTIEE